ncbi:16114_t:CDS:2, partial [Cetraspora pellucida]
IAYQVSPFTIKEIIEFFLASSLYEPYMFEHVPKLYIKFVDDDIELVINNINDDLNLIYDQDSKSRRRARIMELGCLLTKSDDEGVTELKSRKQELESLLAATCEGPQHINFSQRIPRKIPLMQRKR